MENQNITTTSVEPVIQTIEPPLEPPTMIKKKKGSSREYNREYYHRTKKEVECEFCKKTYAAMSGLVRHQRRSSNCGAANRQNVEHRAGLHPRTGSSVRGYHEKDGQLHC